MNVPMEYHILFLAMSFVLFIITIFLLFWNVTLEKAVASNITIMFNMVLCIIVALLFSGIDIYGHDTTGAIVHNVISDMHPFAYLYLVMFYVNLMLMFYCIYLFIKKPWDDLVEHEKETIYYDTPY